ncbi:MAG: hypothetical protein ACXIU7_05345 [Roseinatronobacter sp.]
MSKFLILSTPIYALMFINSALGQSALAPESMISSHFPKPKPWYIFEIGGVSDETFSTAAKNFPLIDSSHYKNFEELHLQFLGSTSGGDGAPLGLTSNELQPGASLRAIGAEAGLSTLLPLEAIFSARSFDPISQRARNINVQNIRSSQEMYHQSDVICTLPDFMAFAGEAFPILMLHFSNMRKIGLDASVSVELLLDAERLFSQFFLEKVSIAYL